jgi:hypothetical protein
VQQAHVSTWESSKNGDSKEEINNKVNKGRDIFRSLNSILREKRSLKIKDCLKL